MSKKFPVSSLAPSGKIHYGHLKDDPHFIENPDAKVKVGAQVGTYAGRPVHVDTISGPPGTRNHGVTFSIRMPPGIGTIYGHKEMEKLKEMKNPTEKQPMSESLYSAIEGVTAGDVNAFRDGVHSALMEKIADRLHDERAVIASQYFREEQSEENSN